MALVGLPGCGKSSVARVLAKHYGWAALDTDSVLESRIGMSIRDFFAEKGEPAFRILETEALEQCLAKAPPLLLATGGGIVLAERNRSLLHSKTLCFYLRSTPEETASTRKEMESPASASASLAAPASVA